jgi:hypothetical protein
MVYPLAVVAALVVAGGEVIQQRVARRASRGDDAAVLLLLRLVRRRRWLAGVAFAVVGNLALASALDAGNVVLVEAVFLIRLPFGLVISAMWGWHRVPPRDLAAGMAVVVGTAAFLVCARPRHGTLPTHDLAWVAGIGAVVGTALVLARVARLWHGARRATLLGAGAGMMFGLQTVLTKSAMHVLRMHGVAGMLATWEPYAVVAAALTGMLLLQSAFASAALPASYPTLITGQLVAATGLALWVLNGQLRTASPYGYLIVPELVLALAGIVVLTRTPLLLRTLSPEARGDSW